MRQLFLSRLMFPFLALALLGLGALSFRFTLADTNTYYVLAQSGLNLRKDADPNSAKLDLIPLGGKITLLAPPQAKNMNIDQLTGGMAKVKYGDKTGFVFDGYLSKFPAPKQSINAPGGYTLENYVDKLRSASDLGIILEDHKMDYGGIISTENSIHLPTENWQEAFLIAKLLLNIPPKLLYPKVTRAVETIIPNPDKKEQAWSDELQVTRDKTGALVSIYYYYRAEGGGWGAKITKSTEQAGEGNKMLKVAYTGIAD